MTALNRMADNKGKTMWLLERQLTGGNRPHPGQAWVSYPCQQDPILVGILETHAYCYELNTRRNALRVYESGGGRRLTN